MWPLTTFTPLETNYKINVTLNDNSTDPVEMDFQYDHGVYTVVVAQNEPDGLHPQGVFAISRQKDNVSNGQVNRLLNTPGSTKGFVDDKETNLEIVWKAGHKPALKHTVSGIIDKETTYSVRVRGL